MVGARRHFRASLHLVRANVVRLPRRQPAPLEHGMHDIGNRSANGDCLMRRGRRRWKRPHESGHAGRCGPERCDYVQRRGRHAQPNAESFDQRPVADVPRLANGTLRLAGFASRARHRCAWRQSKNRQATAGFLHALKDFSVASVLDLLTLVCFFGFEQAQRTINPAYPTTSSRSPVTSPEVA